MNQPPQTQPPQTGIHRTSNPISNPTRTLSELDVEIPESGVSLAGYTLLAIGHIVFLGGVIDLLLNPTSRDGTLCRFAGYLIVPGWLLLRLAAGLFPFGRRIFK